MKKLPWILRLLPLGHAKTRDADFFRWDEFPKPRCLFLTLSGSQPNIHLPIRQWPKYDAVRWRMVTIFESRFSPKLENPPLALSSSLSPYINSFKHTNKSTIAGTVQPAPSLRPEDDTALLHVVKKGPGFLTCCEAHSPNPDKSTFWTGSQY